MGTDCDYHHFSERDFQMALLWITDIIRVFPRDIWGIESALRISDADIADGFRSCFLTHFGFKASFGTPAMFACDGHQCQDIELDSSGFMVDHAGTPNHVSLMYCGDMAPPDAEDTEEFLVRPYMHTGGTSCHYDDLNAAMHARRGCVFPEMYSHSAWKGLEMGASMEPDTTAVTAFYEVFTNWNTPTCAENNYDGNMQVHNSLQFQMIAARMMANNGQEHNPMILDNLHRT